MRRLTRQDGSPATRSLARPRRSRSMRPSAYERIALACVLLRWRFLGGLHGATHGRQQTRSGEYFAPRSYGRNSVGGWRRGHWRCDARFGPTENQPGERKISGSSQRQSAVRRMYPIPGAERLQDRRRNDQPEGLVPVLRREKLSHFNKYCRNKTHCQSVVNHSLRTRLTFSRMKGDPPWRRGPISMNPIRRSQYGCDKSLLSLTAKT